MTTLRIFSNKTFSQKLYDYSSNTNIIKKKSTNTASQYQKRARKKINHTPVPGKMFILDFYMKKYAF